MSTKQAQMITYAIVSVLSLGTLSLSLNAKAEESMHPMSNIKGMEKCYGIARAHQNDCGTATHNCAGEAKQNSDPSEYVLVPTGLCKKIVGGKTKG